MLAIKGSVKYNSQDFDAEQVMAESSQYATIGKVLITQTLIIMVVSVGFGIFSQVSAGFSAILGGSIALLPNLYFAYQTTKDKSGDAKRILHTFYASEARKILLTGAMFTVAFQLPGVQFFPLMICFISALLVFWLALILFAHDFDIENVRKDG